MCLALTDGVKTQIAKINDMIINDMQQVSAASAKILKVFHFFIFIFAYFLTSLILLIIMLKDAHREINEGLYQHYEVYWNKIKGTHYL